MGFKQFFIKRIGKLSSKNLSLLFNKSCYQNLCPPYGETLCFVLFPKLKNAHKEMYFKSLSLCNTHYKILAKFLENHIKPHLQTLISPFQGEFTLGRHASDLFMVAHETMHSMNTSKAKNGWLILKIDLTKDFDNISWPFFEKSSFYIIFPNLYSNPFIMPKKHKLYSYIQ